MKRTQLYLDDDLWNALHARARTAGTTISDLARQAIREQYVGRLDQRRLAMQALVGARKEHPEFSDSKAYVRKLRRGTRLDRLDQ